MKAGDLDENAFEIRVTCHPVKDPGDNRGKESENKSVTPSATKEKAGAVNMDMSGNKDESVENSEEINRKSQNQRETETVFGRLNLQDKRQQKFSSADFPEGGPSVKQDHETSRREDATEEECHDNTEDGEQSKILSVEEVLLRGNSAETKDLRLHQLCEESQDDPVNQSEAEHSVKNGDSAAGGESETKSVPLSVTNMKGSYTSTGELDKVKEVNNEISEQSVRENETLAEASLLPPQTDSPEAGELDENAAEIKMTCHPVKDPGDGGGRKSENESVTPPATKDKAGAVNMDMSGNKDESVKSEEINRKSQNRRETETLFGRLNLQDKRQQKFSSADFLKIGPPVKQDHETCEKDLAYSFLQRLMMLDYRARYIPVKQDSAEVSHSNPVETEDDDEDFFSTSVNQSEQSHVHPMDVQMAVFHCSDSFLKQSMVTKLSQCQYAVPLLVPDPDTTDIDCPLWALRSIRKAWKITETKGDSNTVTMKSMSMCQAETPMVSFFRLGSLSLSKSQLMNTLINIRHDTFFHRNCPGSTKSRYLMDGVAEIAWYCPAGKPNDAFTDCTAFSNLHGDALLNEKQRDILTEKSSVNVAFVETLEKGEKCASVISALLKSQKPLIVLIADSDSATVQKKEGKYKIGLKDRGQADVSEELKGIIRNILSGQHTSFQLETMATVPGIRVDEDDQVCKEGKSAAMKIDKLLQKMDVSEIKDRFLPCHGQLWHKWCKTNKALYHLKGNIEQEKSKKQEELEQIRQEQRTASCSELIELFIESLSSLKSTEYFLKWTQIFIDALSTDDLSSILQSYDEKWSEVLALKKKHDKSEELKEKQAELNQISTKLQSATFGLEHIFREMGQIYEAHASLEKRPMTERTDWSKYPELAAELMISGHPMELMDGDARHVPLTWIFSLLDEVIKKLGDQKVFVLSVLGVQSSGKSTMLNAMFGLQFAVSAGRCTRGAFMQLVKVSEETKKDFQFDYVLVVDTEGLRALELAGSATLHHDNELATFVVGLGNMTLINIFGENPADMQDVLQIVVQAFMRMKEVKLSPSCMFVHQNVTDIAAAEMNMDGKRRLQEKLDQMAQLAAKEEVCDAECFSDVIAFDVQEDVKYFAQLWEGSPPMAPPNPGYSESVQDLRNFILSKASKSAGITLSQFKSKVHDLWKALLNENFVFSFKNTHEIAVYRKLEVEYGKWTWALRKDMLTVENQLYNRIENGKLDNVELRCLYTEMIKTSEEVKRDLATYFDDNEDKEMLAQWRGRFENKIKEFHDDQVRGVKRKLDEVIQQKKARKNLDDKKTEFENKLLQKSKELAHQLKDKENNEEERRKQFDSVWQGLVTELTKDIKPIEDINYEEDQLKILQDLGFEWLLLEQSKQGGNYKDIPVIGDYSGYTPPTKHQDQSNTGQQLQGNEKVKGTSRLGRIKNQAKDFVGRLNKMIKWSLSFDEKQHIRSLIDIVEIESLDIIKSKPVATRGYSPAYLQEVATNVKEKVAAFESKWKYALKKDFTIDLVLYVFDRAEKWLSESHKKFQVANDAVSYLDGKKGLYYNIFRGLCEGSSSAVVLGELICEKLKTSTVEAVCNKTAIDIAGEMKCSHPAFSGNRLNLEKHVLKSLAEKEDFDGFINYIRRPRDQVEIFIKDKVQKYIFTEQREKALKVFKKNVEDINTLLSQALFDATEKVKTQEGNTEMWVEEFSCLLQDKLKFTICYSSFSEKDTESKTENETDQKDLENKTLDVLKEEIENGLKSIMKEMSSLSLDEMNKFRKKPDEILIDQLCKCCWVKCPFCAAVCTNTVENHSPDKHRVPFHRPSGIIGWHIRNTDELVTDFCTTLVASNRTFYPSHDSDVTCPYKEYPKAGGKYAEWIITPDESKLTYWKWFVSRFQKQLEEHHNLKFHRRGEIPSEWRNYSKDEAIESLDEM